MKRSLPKLDTLSQIPAKWEWNPDNVKKGGIYEYLGPKMKGSFTPNPNMPNKAAIWDTRPKSIGTIMDIKKMDRSDDLLEGTKEKAAFEAEYGTQLARAQERKSAEQAEVELQEQLSKAKTPTQKRNVRSKVPSDVQKWLINNPKIRKEWGSSEAAWEGYSTWLSEGRKAQMVDRSDIGQALPEGVEAHTEHAVSLKGDPKKQTGPSPTQYRETIRGSDDTLSKFPGSAYYNVHQGAKDSFTAQQMEELELPKNWRESAAYFFAFGEQPEKRLSTSEWLALQQGEVTAEQLKAGGRIDGDHVAKIEDIHKQEVAQSIKDKYSKDSKSHKKLSKEKLVIEELTRVHPDYFTETKLDRAELSIEAQAKADILAKDPAVPNLKNVKGPLNYFDTVKTHLQSQGFQREAARLAGQSHNPIMNIAGDFVGTVYDGLAVAANPKDKKAIAELMISGTQLATSTVGGVLIAIPDPLTGGAGYVIMKAGDRVGQLERLWNMSREGINLARGKLNIRNRVSGTEVAEIRSDIEDDFKIQEPSFDARQRLRLK